MEPYDNENYNKVGQFSGQYTGEQTQVPDMQVPVEELVYGKPRKHGFGAGVVVGMLLCLALILIGLASVVLVLNGGKGSASAKKGSVINKQSMAKAQRIESIIDALYYKDEDIDIKKMEDGMYAGIVSSLGDIYSVYYNEEEMAELMKSTQGIYYGIGAYLSLDTKTGYGVVAGNIPDTPAEEAGLRYGDLIVEIDHEDAQGLTLEEIVSKVRGEKGTTVHLTLYREGEPDYIEVDITRRAIDNPTVKFDMLDNGIGYIQITEFDDVTTDQFTDAYATIKGNNAKGLILDLRGNPGGNVDTVVAIGRQLLPKGNVFYSENKNGKRKEYTCNGENEIKIPVVVLVDMYSASASEILAGAIQDYGVGKLVGTTTFGKGIVQRVIALSDGTAMKITESAYYTPSGRNIHGIGIKPDVEVPFDGKAYYDNKYDNQLEKGKEVLLEMMK